MLPHQEKVDSFAEFFSDVEPRLRGAFTAAFGVDVGLGWRSMRVAAPGLSSDERERLKVLEREVRELRRANEILKAASAFFAAELDGPRS